MSSRPLSYYESETNMHEDPDSVWQVVFELPLVPSISIVVNWKHFY